jgi:hypothetical protein
MVLKSSRNQKEIVQCKPNSCTVYKSFEEKRKCHGTLRTRSKKAPKETATVGDEARNKAPEARTGNGKQKLAPAITTAIANLCPNSKQKNPATTTGCRLCVFRYSCFFARLDLGFGV